MRLYHGSGQIVNNPKFGAGRPYKDFGPGFYCSESKELAAEWAVTPSSNGYISAYAINTDNLRITDLCSSKYNPLHWIRILMDFREFDAGSTLLHDAKEYISRNYFVDYQVSDCIAGYRADSSTFSFAQDFLNGRISYQRLRSLLTAHPCKQFVIRSKRAFEGITYVSYESAECSDFYPAMNSREVALLRAAAGPAGAGELFITQMIEEDIKSYDSRLR